MHWTFVCVMARLAALRLVTSCPWMVSLRAVQRSCQLSQMQTMMDVVQRHPDLVLPDLFVWCR